MKTLFVKHKASETRSEMFECELKSYLREQIEYSGLDNAEVDAIGTLIDEAETPSQYNHLLAKYGEGELVETV